ncbi:polysaccharide deacetylase family protein [Actinacidiphila rubida]|uniref:Peptidoglycan/xylan/chitin deacetylase, PgdA/CDA1 family n=1 Tax=Actinacidiphila rubida TaxID=310780 RepID=A0A1H8TPA5_9ACTN|nr:polysaccharide deacetylase family protein [Actinacidiphila rubida]SEO92666.1 Peptidoglycan/xylan/chitin deacetylase, PgdA/CDA1 family [Actinacidiphila rubida]
MTPELVLPARRSRTASRAPWALMYHAVGDPRDDPYLVTVGPERLARQLRWLSRHGLTGVSMRELLAAREQGRADRLVGLTFDDGYADFLTEAVPLLREHGHTATVFVLPGRLGGANDWDAEGPRRPLLDAAGIRAAEAAGMEIGSHGLVHQDLTAADDATLAAEATESRRLIGEITGTAPVGFCHPYGALDTRTLAAVRRAGYAYACAVDPGPLAGLYALPRAYVGNRDNSPRLHAKRLLHRMRGPYLTDPSGHGDRPQRPEPSALPREDS